MTGISAMEIASPFDAIRRNTPEGREWWSARELQPLLDYIEWRKFTEAINRARVSGHNAGHDMSRHIVGAAKMVELGSGAQRSVEDHHLSRFACYLIAMNGDPRKGAVAQAQTYFAVKTREAETVRAPVALTDDEIMHQALTISSRRIGELTEKVAELEPKAQFYDELMDADGCYSMQAVANMLGWGRNVMMRELRRMGVLQGNRLPYRRYAHHFKVVPGTYTNGEGETIPTATTKVLPSGIDFLRKKLDRSPVVAS